MKIDFELTGNESVETLKTIIEYMANDLKKKETKIHTLGLTVEFWKKRARPVDD